VDSVLHTIIHLLTRFGPWIVLVACFAETALLIGLLLPSEATVIVAAFFANRGAFPVWQVFVAAVIGGLAGDQIAFWLGRRRGDAGEKRRGRMARMWERHEPAVRRLFEKKSALAITLARCISFVRTLMPAFAGMSDMPYARFFIFDLIGVVAWAAASVAIGYVAGASWKRVAGTVGSIGIVLSIAAIGAAFVFVRRRRPMRKRA
jgi:membrane-associated protein